MHIERPGIVRTVHSNIFKDMQTYSGILMHIQPLSQALNQKVVARPFPHFLKSVLMLKIRPCMRPSLSSIFHSKCQSGMAYSKFCNIQNSSIIAPLSYLQTFADIQNSDIFKTQHILNPLKDLRWSFLQKQSKTIIIFPKCFILDL